MKQPDQSPLLRVNPLALVLVAVVAGGALPYIGATATGAILSLGFVVYGTVLLAQKQRVLGALFIVGAIAIVAALLLRGA